MRPFLAIVTSRSHFHALVVRERPTERVMADTSSSPIAAVILATGIALGGFLFGRGVSAVRSADRYVTVKGVSEREVKANVAFWPLRVVVSDNDLGRAQAKLATSVSEIKAFLARQGVDTAGAVVQGLEVSDAYANQYREPGQVTARYVIHQTLIARSDKPETVMAASQHVGDLVRGGVVLSSGGDVGTGGPTFLFTQLNALKPPMIAEATAQARAAAEQFARDSKSALGSIRRASQGVFEILPREQAPGISEESQLYKVVRVVTTVDYYLGR